jgi:hypothetical protein
VRLPEHTAFLFHKYSARRSKSDAQLLVTKKDLTFLQRDSYINTGALYKFRERELSDARLVGQLTNALKKQIAIMVSRHGYLTEIQKQLVLNNFG